MNSQARYPYLEFVLRIGTWDWHGDGLVDTGFEGGLIIPIGVSREILSSTHTTRFVLPGGSAVIADIWSGEFEIALGLFRIEVAGFGHRCLIGREVIDQLDICFLHGKELQVTKP